MYPISFHQWNKDHLAPQNLLISTTQLILAPQFVLKHKKSKENRRSTYKNVYPQACSDYPEILELHDLCRGEFTV